MNGAFRGMIEGGLIMKSLRTPYDVVMFLRDVDIQKEHRNNTEAYKVWNVARYLIPNSPDQNYMIGTHQEYIICSWKNKPWFRELMLWHPGLRDLYYSFIQSLDNPLTN